MQSEFNEYWKILEHISETELATTHEQLRCNARNAGNKG